ncbi:hypothetical protein [Rhizobium leguminosarum]|uniref:hypothetical protein n=1 Tax=Rhizobium leguminosarum TaxID=384 RepID=UPI00103EF93E|nr:hypothetical protein [Rhizobium leguminosarum]TCA26254.1 hypothetical protein E0H67_04865 [Rhizobium leguminosarum bv. viciae]
MKATLRKILTLAASLSFIGLPVSSYSKDTTAKPAYLARKKFDTRRLTQYEAYFKEVNCGSNTSDLENCANVVAYQIIYYYEHQNYKKVIKLLPMFYNFTHTDTGSVCPGANFEHDGVEYTFNYYQDGYQIYSKIAPDLADNIMLRAYICESAFSHVYKGQASHIEKEDLGFENFKKVVLKRFGNGPEYNVDLYVWEIIKPMRERYDVIRAGKKWKENDDVDVKDGVAIVKLMDNAAAYCEKQKLAAPFCDFLHEYSAWIATGTEVRSKRL